MIPMNPAHCIWSVNIYEAQKPHDSQCVLNIRYPGKACSAHFLVTTAWFVHRLQCKHTITSCFVRGGINTTGGNVCITLLHHKERLQQSYRNISKSNKKNQDQSQEMSMAIHKNNTDEAYLLSACKTTNESKKRRYVVHNITQHILRTQHRSMPTSRLPQVELSHSW